MLAQLKKSFLFFTILLLTFFLGCGASSKNSLNKIYGEDSQYFLGLEELKNGNQEKAKKCFTRCVKKGGYYPARKSSEQLALMGNIQDKIKSCKEFIKKYDDDQAKFFACNEFTKNKEYALVIEATEKIDLATAPNELIRLRLDAMARKNDSRLEQTVYDWFTKRRISADHYNFYRENARDELEGIITGEGVLQEQFSDFTFNANFMQQFRIAIYRGNYNAAFELLEEIRDMTIKYRNVPLTYQIVADMGRACLNGSHDNVKNADFFWNLANDKSFKDNKIKYYAALYSGILYDKNENTRSRALKHFEIAMGFATEDEERDQAIWYYLQSCLKMSVDTAVDGLRYARAWKDPSYFDDFFDLLSVLLFSSGKWNLFAQVYSNIKDYASPAMVSKFSYLTGRIMQAEFIIGSDAEIEAAFRDAVACDAGTYVYYRLLAARQLGFSTQQIEKMFFEESTSAPIKIVGAKENAIPDERTLSARRLLLGYADFGFGEKIYDEWQMFFEQDKNMIDLETVAKLAAFLQKLDDGQNGCYTKSLRMISRTANLDDKKISREAFLLLYPQDFKEPINMACKEFEIDDYVMYALVRTESFFEPSVQSHAGAIGLTQLMESTAADCAARLKVSDYDLNDPATNVRFGTYYFSSMVSRLEGSQILALFAYNAGITNVRRWIRGSKIQLDAQGKIPSDLFLETLPFAETRDYGRRVISAAAMYAWLYDGINPCDVASTMM